MAPASGCAEAWLEIHRAGRNRLTSVVAWVVYVALVPIVALVAARRRRLLARAVEGVVRAVVAGVEVPTALTRAVAWLEGKGLDPLQARADLERLLAGFLSAPSGDASAAEPAPRTSTTT